MRLWCSPYWHSLYFPIIMHIVYDLLCFCWLDSAHLYPFHPGLLRWVYIWRHQMETFSALLAICAGNSPVPGEFPTQRPVTRSFDVYFDLRPDNRLSKQSWGWWFETLSHSLWRHRNVGQAYACSRASTSTLNNKDKHITRVLNKQKI